MIEKKQSYGKRSASCQLKISFKMETSSNEDPLRS